LTKWFRIGLRFPRTCSAKPSRSPGKYFTQRPSEYDLIASKPLQSLPKTTKVTTNNTVFLWSYALYTDINIPTFHRNVLRTFSGEKNTLQQIAWQSYPIRQVFLKSLFENLTSHITVGLFPFNKKRVNNLINFILVSAGGFAYNGESLSLLTSYTGTTIWH